jgi:hypothetical protein
MGPGGRKQRVSQGIAERCRFVPGITEVAELGDPDQ